MKNQLMKRVFAALLSFVLVLTVAPVTSFAEDTAYVSSASLLDKALEDDNVKYIHFTGSFGYTSDLDTDKTIIIDESATFYWIKKTGNFRTGNLIINGTFIVRTEDSFVSRLNVFGPVENNGTIEVERSGYCFWRSPTTGNGKFIGTAGTYIDYGTLPEQMMPETCKINIMKDFSLTSSATVTLNQNELVPGNTVIPTVSNLIDGVDISEVYNITWENPPITNPLSKETSYTIPANMSGKKLQVSVSCKPGYAMVTPNGTLGTIDSEVYTVDKTEFTTFYVDEQNGSDGNIGSKEKPLQTMSYALNNISDNGTIVLMSDYYCENDNVYAFIFSKNITVKGGTSEKVKFHPSEDIEIKDGVTASFDNIDFDSYFIPFTKLSSSSAGTGNVLFNNVSGTKLHLSDIGSVTVKNSNLGGTFKISCAFTINDSVFSGGLTCYDFVSHGNSELHMNSSLSVLNSISVDNDNPVAIAPPDLDNGYIVVKLPEGDNSNRTSEFVVYDSDNGRYTLKLRKVSSGDCLVVTEKAAASGPFHIAGVPKENSEVSDVSYVGVSDKYCASVSSAVWSGYSDTAAKKWVKGDIPELTVVLNTDFTQAYTDSFYFENDFDPSNFIYYDWADISKPASDFYTDQYIISGVTAVVKEGQGVSNDGRNFTFTLVFPEIGVTHNLIKVDYKAPNCTQNGNIEYWYCSDCGKCFSNESASKEITLEDTVIPATGHSYKYSHHLAGSDGTYLVYSCTVCGAEHEETKNSVLDGFMKNFNKLRDDTENGYLYDVNFDGHINSRDYAIIQEYHK